MLKIAVNILTYIQKVNYSATTYNNAATVASQIHIIPSSSPPPSSSTERWEECSTSLADSQASAAQWQANPEVGRGDGWAGEKPAAPTPEQAFTACPFPSNHCMGPATF